ncbi:MAG: HAD-IC family P-type ATPase, partial [Christensenellaceae bacterium]
EVTILNRTPFSSEIKYMSTALKLNGRELTYYKGAPEVIAKFCKIPYFAEQKISEYQSMSLRVIAFCHKEESNVIFDGFAAIIDKLRKDVRSSIDACKNAGITVKILTGDNAKTAQAIALELGLYGKVLSGDEIEKMSPERLRAEIKGVAIVARSTPLAKLKVVKALQELGEVVAVTGDGVNDAPAIKRADIGIAMGSGSEITKEAGDIILLDNSFSTIVKAITFGRNVFCNFQRFLSFQLTVNLSSMCIIIAFLVLGFDCPFSSTCLLWLNVIMDGPLAISLGLESRSVDLTQVGPTRRKDDILSPKLLARILVHSLFIGFVVSLQKIYNFLEVPTSEASTVIFVLFVLMQLFNALNCREIRTKSVFFDFFGNKLLLVMCVITFLLQIIIIGCFPQFFASTPLCFATWIKVIVTASSLLWFAEGYKFVLRSAGGKKLYYKKSKALNNG